MPHAQFYTEWLEHDGKTVLINGIAHVLKVRTYAAYYPYHHETIHVDAVPKNKQTKWYREQRAKLGDDFMTDVLSSDVEVQTEILRQCGNAITCETCGGDGRVPVKNEHVIDRGDKFERRFTETLNVECPDCDGTGVKQ